jgi:SAM-dependent methyltransferase
MVERDLAGLEANRQRFTGFAETYNTYRPHPPPILADILCQLAGTKRPKLVVDLGSGTGLSTRYWAGKAERAIGVEPSADMRAQALAATTATNVTYVTGFSHATGLVDDSTDIITCAQSLHWMLPGPTFTEAARILRSGGVLAAYDYDWPPLLPDWKAEKYFRHFMDAVHSWEHQLAVNDRLVVAEKNEHITRLEQSGEFRFTREFMLHHIDAGNADRLVGLVLSLGGVQSLLKQGLTPNEIGIELLKTQLENLLGTEAQRWIWAYRVRVGVK